jgi:endonuclease/exonuclease/phosphatase family metal-dependent hydrolase
MAESIRIATFNLGGAHGSGKKRLETLRSQLRRLRADVLCLQEVNGHKIQDRAGRLPALGALLKETPYAEYAYQSTVNRGGEPFGTRNLVVASRFSITSELQILHELLPRIPYSFANVRPQGKSVPRKLSWDRPILYVQLKLEKGQRLHLINLHLKSNTATPVPGQRRGPAWESVAGWAEGYYVSLLKRVGQALEARMLIDQLFVTHGEEILMAVSGSLGSDTDEEATKVLRGPVAETRNARLHAQVLLKTDRMIPQRGRFTVLHRNQGKLLDRILVSKRLVSHLVYTEIHNEALWDRSDVRQPRQSSQSSVESDHAPVVAEFRMG